MKRTAILFTLLTSLLLISSSAGALSSSTNISSSGSISYPAPSKATVIISATAGGTTNPASGTYQYDLNTIVTITATPNSGFTFKNWLIGGATTNTSNPISFNVTTATTYSYQAVFESTTPPVYTVPIPNTPKYQNWALTRRVTTDFESYISGTSFDFTGFFNHQYSLFLAELDAVPWSDLQTYVPNAPTWSPPSYQAGEPINGGGLKALALAGAGRVVSSGTAADINNAISALSPSQWLVYVEPGIYDGKVVVGRPNTVLAGAGWNTTIRKTSDYWAAIQVTASNVIVRDLSADGNGATFPTQGGNTIVAQNTASPFLLENCFAFDEYTFGINPRGGLTRNYIINTVSSNSGANTFELTNQDHSAMVGNYADKWVDVGMGTWGSSNLLIANNVFENPVSPHWGAYTRANWAIGTEAYTSGPPQTYNILIRDNDASDLKGQADRGTGVWITENSHHILVVGGTYNNNNNCGSFIEGGGSYQGYIAYYAVQATGNVWQGQAGNIDNFHGTSRDTLHGSVSKIIYFINM